jgi:hypothetical protein
MADRQRRRSGRESVLWVALIWPNYPDAAKRRPRNPETVSLPPGLNDRARIGGLNTSTDPRPFPLDSIPRLPAVGRVMSIGETVGGEASLRAFSSPNKAMTWSSE